MSVKAGFEALMSRKYLLWGETVTLRNTRTGASFSLRMIDNTRGVEVGDGMVTLATVEPAAMVRKSDLTAQELRASDLIGTCFTLNGSNWRVQSTQPKPTVHGAEYGEMVLLLARAND